MPNILLQMLLRASNGVGYTNYPDNVVRYFVQQAAASGVDIFRIFDALNWVENMRIAIDAVLDTGKLAEAAVCYTGNLSDPACTKYDLRYYVTMAKQLEAAGAHVLGIKDVAGLCRPQAARDLVTALKQEISIPIHFHTHDTSGVAAASVLAAIDAGVDAVDAAMDSMSGLTSQPNLGSIVEALRHGSRESALNPESIRTLSHYWEEVRAGYLPFESEERAGASEVYVHGMPSGQYTNLREQARALSLGDRWPEVGRAYAEVNDMFGDIVKVTPSSKVVGDMALMMVTSGLSRAEVEDPDTDIAFPDSVVSFFRGEIGQPYGGFPAALQRKVLNGAQPLTQRPGETLPALDLKTARTEAEHRVERKIPDQELASYLMYPEVFVKYAQARRQYGDLTMLPTSVFFYGMGSGEEVTIEIDSGRSLIVRYLGASEHHDDGLRTVFFESNGQPRQIKVEDLSQAATKMPRRKAEASNICHVGAPMPGLIAQINVRVGEAASKGDALMVIEAMKMQTSIRAERDGRIVELAVEPGHQVDSKDLLAVYE